MIIEIDLPASWRGGFENAVAILTRRHPGLSQAELMTRLLIAGVIGVVESEVKIRRLRKSDFAEAVE